MTDLFKSACTTLGRAAATAATPLLEIRGGKVDPVDVQAASVQRTADACTFAQIFEQHTKTTARPNPPRAVAERPQT
jgi:hypothetical protein